MTQTMKAAVVHAFGEPLRIEEVPVPTPGPGQILVNIKASGVCHTDLHAADGDWPVKPTLPFIPGHEGVGVVAAVGAGVTHVREGDRVGVPWLYTACGHCEHCYSGWETLCHRQQNTGYSVNGSYAEYVLADSDYVGHLPAQVAFDEIAPILCAGVMVYKGIRVTDTRPGQWIAISGIGGLGHVAVQYARAMGLHVAAIDVAPDKLALAKQLGAELTIDASSVDPAAVIQKEIGGAHGVLVTAVSRSAFAQALGMVRRGGTVALNGLPPGDFPLPIFSTVLNGITVRGSIAGTRRDLQESLDFAADGLGSVHANNGLANVPCRAQCKEQGAPFGRAKQATRDAAMRPARHVPVTKNSIVGLAAGRADRRVMLLANTPGIRCVPFLALGPSGGQRKPVISVNRPWRAHIHRDRLANINDIFAKLRAGQVDGRIVLTDLP